MTPPAATASKPFSTDLAALSLDAGQAIARKSGSAIAQAGSRLRNARKTGWQAAIPTKAPSTIATGEGLGTRTLFATSRHPAAKSPAMPVSSLSRRAAP
jgi:hypothetical protein